MPFKRFVETGRVAFLTDWPFEAKICCIVDCIDQKSRASLTDFDRFELKRARSVANKIRTEEYNKLLKHIYHPIRKSQAKKRAKARAQLKRKAGKAMKGKESKKARS